MAPVDVMRRYLQAVQRGDWATGFCFFADDTILHVPGLRGEQIVELWIFEANQYEVDDLFADPIDG